MLKDTTELREFDDVDKTREYIYSGALEAVQKRFPVEDDNFRLELQNAHYSGPQTFSLEQQKQAIMRGRRLQTPISGHWRLTHKPTGQVLDERDDVVMDVPYYTPRGTFIHGGNEYSIINQGRLRPGAYVRKQRTGEIEGHVNVRPGKGKPFRVHLEPKTGVFKVNVGQANIPLYPLMKAMGVSDKQLVDSWGAELASANAAKHDARAMSKLYTRFAGYKAEEGLDETQMAAYLRDALPAFEMDEDVNARTLGLQGAKGMTPEVMLRLTGKMLGVSRGDEQPDDRDHPQFSQLYGVEDLVRERIDKDAGRLTNNLLYKIKRSRNLSPVRRGALNSYVEGLILGSGLAMPLEETNPLSTLEQMGRLTKLGEGGIGSAEAITNEARDVNPGQFGFIDPIAGPEGCQTPDMEVMARTGWVKWPDVTTSTELACLVDGRVEFHYPEEVHCFHHDGYIYEVQTKHFGYRVSGDHKIWCRASDPGSEYRWERAATMLERSRVLRVSTDGPFEGKPAESFVVPPVSGGNAVKTETIEIPIGDWFEFLGWYVSEGSCGIRSDGNHWVSISQHKGESNLRIKDLLGRLPFGGCESRCGGEPHGFMIVRKQLWAAVKDLGKASTKRMPEYVFDAPVEARRRLLESLCLGDGRRKGKTYTYCTTSSELALQVERLAFGLGYSVRVRFEPDAREQSSTGGCWAVHLHTSKERCITKPHHSRTPYCGPVYCATVPGSQLYCRRGSFGGHWTGNLNIGIDVRTAYRTFKGKDHNLYAEFLDPKTGENTYMTPGEASDRTIGFPGQSQDDPYIYAMRRGAMERVPREEVDAFVPSFAHMFNPNTNINPMPTGVQAGRQFYGSKFWSQYMPQVQGEVPLVDTLMPDGDRTFTEYYGRKVGTLSAPVSGRVVKVADNAVVVQGPDGKRHTTELVRDLPFNRITAVSYFPSVQVGDTVEEGGMLAHSNFTDSKTGALNLGRNLRTAVIPARGESYEDAYVISQSAAEKLSTERLMGIDLEATRGISMGKNEYISVFPQNFSKEQVEKLDDSGVVRPGQTVYKGDPLILATGPRMLTAEDSQLGKLHKTLRQAKTNKAETWEYDWPGTITDVAVTSKGARVNVKATPPVAEGDKLCYDSETEVLTSEGWKLFSALTVEDCVAALNPSTGVFEYIPPVAIQRFDHTGKMYRLKSQQLDLLVTPNHNLYVQPRYAKSFGLYRADEVMGNRMSFKKDGIWKGKETTTVTLPGTTKGHRWGSISVPPLELPVDTYMMLLGMFLSEGNCIDHAGSSSYGIQFTQTKPRGVERMLPALRAAGFNGVHNTKSGKFSIFDKRMLNHFRQFGHAHDKFIPSEIFELPVENLRVLFDWLMWGDGHTCDGRPIFYSTVSPRLADDVQRLCLHIGYAANVNCRPLESVGLSKIGDRVITANYDIYNVRIITTKLTPTINHGHVKAQTAQTEEWVDYTGDVFCCTLPKWHVLYVRRGGKPAWCGNSTRLGLKGVVGKVVPDDEMPRDPASNEPYELLLNPMAVLSRLAPNQIVELALGKLARATGKQIRLPQDAPKEGWANWAQAQLDEAGISDSSDIFDPQSGKTIRNIGDGSIFISAFHHLAEKKLSSRGDAGGYTSDEQPSKGGSTGAKRYSSMDSYATLAHGATAVLKDAITIRGTKNEEYWKALKLGKPLPEPSVPFIYNKFLNTLRAGGINVVEKGDITQILPMTDDDVSKMSSGAIETSAGVDSDFEPVPRGLFDIGRTGGMSGKNWTHIDLPEPVPNPVMEEPIRRMLGLTVTKMEDILTGREKLDGKTGGEALQSALKKLDIEGQIAQHTNKVRTSRGAARDNSVKILGYLSSMKEQGMHPSQWMISKVPVIPPMFRPVSKMGDVALSADLNELYRDVFESSKSYSELKNDLPESELADERLNIYRAVRAAFGLGESITPEGQSRRLKGAIRQVIGDSPKTGMYQSKVLSKTVGGVGRGIVTPDPNLDMDQLGIPEDSAWTMYKSHVMRSLVKRGYPSIRAIDLIDSRAPEAREALEKEMESRPVILDRAPTWHKFNLLAFKPHIVDGHILRVSPLVTKGFNMDFNGDSVKCLYVKYFHKGILFEKPLDAMIRHIVDSSFTEDSAASRYGVGTAIFELTKERDDAMYVAGLDDKGKPSWQMVTHVSVHTSHADECRRVRTRGGLDAVFTGHHNWWMLDGACDLVPVKTEAIGVGTLVPYVYGLTLPEGTVCDPVAPNEFEMSYENGLWFGHFVADGSVTGRGDTISHASVDAPFLTYLETIGTDITGVTPWREGNGNSTRWTSKRWAAYMLEQFGHGAEHKHLPAWVFSAPETFRRGVVVGYILGEGSASSKSCVVVECASRYLLTQFKELLAGLRIESTVGDGHAPRKNSVRTWCIWINVHDFLDAEFSWPSTEKSIQFKSIRRPSIRRSVDNVPIPPCVHSAILARGKEFAGGRGRALREKYASDGLGKCAVDRKQFDAAKTTGMATRPYAESLVRAYRLRDCDDPVIAKWIAVVATDTLRWDPVTLIESAERPPVTYDFSVAGKEAFTFDSGFLTHNTANFHVPVSDKAVQQAREKMMPSSNLFSLTDLKSVRHAPSMEMTFGLYQLTKPPNKKETKVFQTLREAKAAYRSGDISANDPIEVLEMQG